ncbi:MAG: TlpA family protein disulfide reductase [Aureliella sp.]
MGLAISLLTACEKSTSTHSAQSSGNTASSDAASSVKQATSEGPSDKPTAQTAEVKVEQATHEQLLERIKQQDGRVVVVDVWSTSCVPCMKEFPHLVELARRWPDDVTCISMNVDYIGLPSEPVEQVTPKVVKFLESQKANPANMINLISSEADTDMLGKLKVESMPAILVFDRAGQMVSKLTIDNAGEDGLTYAGDVLPLVESLAKPK